MKIILLLSFIFLFNSCIEQEVLSSKKIKESIENNFNLKEGISVDVYNINNKNIIDIKLESLDTNIFDLNTILNYTCLQVYWELSDSERLIADSIKVQLDNNKAVFSQANMSKINYLYDYEVSAAVAYLNGLYFENLSKLMFNCYGEKVEFEDDFKKSIKSLITNKGEIQTYYFNGFELEEDKIILFLQLEHKKNKSPSYYNFVYTSNGPSSKSLCEIQY